MRILTVCEECDRFIAEKMEKSMWYRCHRTSEGFRKEKEYSKNSIPNSCPSAKKHLKESEK